MVGCGDAAVGQFQGLAGERKVIAVERAVGVVIEVIVTAQDRVWRHDDGRSIVTRVEVDRGGGHGGRIDDGPGRKVDHAHGNIERGDRPHGQVADRPGQKLFRANRDVGRWIGQPRGIDGQIRIKRISDLGSFRQAGPIVLHRERVRERCVERRYERARRLGDLVIVANQLAEIVAGSVIAWDGCCCT